MKTGKIKFKSIDPSSYNPRKISRDEMKALSSNLEEFGLVDPIIINLKNNHIVGGHQRYTALEHKYIRNKSIDNIELPMIKLGDIGWVFEEEDLTIKDENHEKALNLALNKISGSWDHSKLSKILNDLNLNHFDMDLTGFDKFEIEKYTIPSDLNLQFKEIRDIKEGTRKPNEEEVTETNTSQTEDNSVETVSEKDENSDDILVSAEEIRGLHQHKCPNCGYEW